MRAEPPTPPTEPETAPPATVDVLSCSATQLADALSCPICLELLKDPLIAACCQNNFCRQCLKSTLLSNPQCPLCRAPLLLENTLPNRAIRNLLPHEFRESSGEAQPYKPTNLSKHPAGCLLLLLVLSTACIVIGRSSGDIFGAACLSAALPGGLWACRVPPETAGEPTVRGGNALEPVVPWGRVAADDAQESPRLLRFNPPVLDEGRPEAQDESAPGGDDDPSSSAADAPTADVWLGDGE